MGSPEKISVIKLSGTFSWGNHTFGFSKNLTSFSIISRDGKNTADEPDFSCWIIGKDKHVSIHQIQKGYQLGLYLIKQKQGKEQKEDKDKRSKRIVPILIIK